MRMEIEIVGMDEVTCVMYAERIGRRRGEAEPPRER